MVGLLVMAISLISAFGVSSSYWDDNPLKLAPGESTIISLGFQNNVGSENLTFRVKLSDDGNGIATLVDENLDYFIPLGSRVGIPIKIEIPEDAKIEDSLTEIVISFTQITEGGGGMVSLAGGITTKIPVKVVGLLDSELYSPKPKKDYKKVFNWAVLIILAAIVLFLLKRKGKLDFLFGKK